MAVLQSLSSSKAYQQNMMMAFEEAFGKETHYGVIKVCGQVAPENKYLNPTYIAGKAVELYEQDKKAWELLAYVKE